MSAAGITYSRHVQLSLGSSQQTGSPVGVLLHCTYRDVYGPVLSEIDVGVFVRAHLHRSQGPHILPSRATGIPSLPVGSSRPLIGQSVRSSCPYRCHFGTNIHLVDHLSIRCIHLLQEGILAATLHYSLDRLQYLPTHLHLTQVARLLGDWASSGHLWFEGICHHLWV